MNEEFLREEEFPDEWEIRGLVSTFGGHATLEPKPGLGRNHGLRQEVNTWKIRFQGVHSELSVQRFLARVEWHAIAAGYSGDHIIGALDLCLEDEALDWFWITVERNPKVNWVQLKQGFILRFAPNVTDEDVRRMLDNRKQRYPRESVLEYFQAVQELALQSEKFVTDGMLYAIIRRNIRPGLQMALHNEVIFSSLAAFIRRCSSLEEMWRRFGHNPEAHLTNPACTPTFPEPIRTSLRRPVPFNSRAPRVQEIRYHDADLDDESDNYSVAPGIAEDGAYQELQATAGSQDIYKPGYAKSNPPEKLEVGDEETSGTPSTEPTYNPNDRGDYLQPGSGLSPDAAQATPLNTKSLRTIACQTDNRRVVRRQNYFRRRRRWRQHITSTIIHSKPDNRPYAKVQLCGKSIEGLLDSGANISVLGHGSEAFLKNCGLEYRPFNSKVHTASGASESIVGYIYVPIIFGDQTKNIQLFIAPGLSQVLYLGTDFWKAFGLRISVSELTTSLNETAGAVTVEEEFVKAHDLTLIQQRELETVKAKFPSSVKLGLGKTHLLEHEIDTGEAKPIKQRYYSISPAKQKEMDQELDRMLELGVIEESSSPWSSPVTVVAKSNGKVRLCLDARKVNSVTVKEAYPLPIIDGLLSRLENTQFISSLDLKDAFWQIPLKQSSRPKTAFTVPGRPLYQFTVMPFGLCNAAQTMCRLMHKVIPHELHDRVFVYLDDLLVTSASFTEHMQLLEIVARQLRWANLTINVEKSKFVLTQLRYLGHIVGGGTIRVDPDKIKAIQDFPSPRSVKQIRSFLGMSGWYRKFIPNFSTVAAPLSDLLKSKGKVIWTEQAQEAFVELKSLMTSAPVLTHPDYTRTFYIQVDASKTGVGSVLFQKDPEGAEHPIAFYSHKLNGAQKNYSITELECLAVVLSVKKFRSYVEGYEFVIITDHASLQWLMNQSDLSGRLARWSLKLQGYTFRIEYRKGTQNVVPDALSRVFTNELAELIPAGALQEIDLQSPAFSEGDYVELVKSIKDNIKTKPDLKIIDGKVLIYRPEKDPDQQTDIPVWKLWLPQGLVERTLSQAHEPPTAAHLGTGKMIEVVRRHFYWPTLVHDIKRYVRQCLICKQTKAVNTNLKPLMGAYKEFERPFQKLYIDFLGPYPRSKSGNSYILIVLDHYSRFVLIKAMRDATSRKVVEYLETEVFPVYSVPEVVHTDNGKQFTSKLFKSVLAKYGVDQILTPVYSPQSNASERVNRSILAAIRAYVEEDHRTWDVFLPQIAGALRNTVHASTVFSPAYLVFGQHMVTHGSQYRLLRMLGGDALGNYTVKSKDDRLVLAQELVLFHLRQAYQANAHRYNLRTTNRNLSVGQPVFVRNFTQSDAVRGYSAKLAKKFVPATVTRRVGQVAYELADNQGKVLGIFHGKDIRA